MYKSLNKLSPYSNTRWTSSRIILPEHREALLQHNLKKQKQPKPQLDEQELEEIGFIITEALYNNTQLFITYWENHTYHTITGAVQYFDYSNKSITINSSNYTKRIPVYHLKSVNTL